MKETKRSVWTWKKTWMKMKFRWDQWLPVLWQPCVFMTLKDLDLPCQLVVEECQDQEELGGKGTINILFLNDCCWISFWYWCNNESCELHFNFHNYSFRTCSTSASISTERETIIRTSNRTIYTAGRPPWYNQEGQLMDTFVIGVCGGSARFVINFCFSIG